MVLVTLGRWRGEKMRPRTAPAPSPAPPCGVAPKRTLKEYSQPVSDP